MIRMNKFRRATDTFTELAAIYLLVILVASLLFAFFEGKQFIDSVWWAFVTSMTVGYGDIYPITLGGRIVAVFLMHSVPLVVAPLVITRLIENTMDDRDKFTDEEQKKLISDVAQIKDALTRVNVN